MHVQSAPGTAETLEMNEEFQILREVKHLEFYCSGSGSDSGSLFSIVLFKVTVSRKW